MIDPTPLNTIDSVVPNIKSMKVSIPIRNTERSEPVSISYSSSASSSSNFKLSSICSSSYKTRHEEVKVLSGSQEAKKQRIALKCIENTREDDSVTNLRSYTSCILGSTKSMFIPSSCPQKIQESTINATSLQQQETQKNVIFGKSGIFGTLGGSNTNIRTLWVGDLDKADTSLHTLKLTNSSYFIKNVNSPVIVDENFLIYTMFYEFSSCITIARVCRDKMTRAVSYGFVEFVKHKQAEYCLHYLNNRWVPGRQLKYKLNWATFNISDSFISNVNNLKFVQDEFRNKPNMDSNSSTENVNNIKIISNGNITSQVGAPQNVNGTSTYSLWVGNLPPHVTQEDMKEIFSAFSKRIAMIKIINDSNTNMCKGYAFVHFYEEADAEAALYHMNGYAHTVLTLGKPIKVNRSNTNIANKMNNRSVISMLSPNMSGNSSNESVNSIAGNSTIIGNNDNIIFACSKSKDSQDTFFDQYVQPTMQRLYKTCFHNGTHDSALNANMKMSVNEISNFNKWNIESCQIGNAAIKKNCNNIKLIICGLKDDCSESLLNKYFSQFGTLSRIKYCRIKQKAEIIYQSYSSVINSYVYLKKVYFGVDKISVSLVPIENQENVESLIADEIMEFNNNALCLSNSKLSNDSCNRYNNSVGYVMANGSCDYVDIYKRTMCNGNLDLSQAFQIKVVDQNDFFSGMDSVILPSELLYFNYNDLHEYNVENICLIYIKKMNIMLFGEGLDSFVREYMSICELAQCSEILKMKHVIPRSSENGDPDNDISNDAYSINSGNDRLQKDGRRRINVNKTRFYNDIEYISYVEYNHYLFRTSFYTCFS